GVGGEGERGSFNGCFRRAGDRGGWGDVGDGDGVGGDGDGGAVVVGDGAGEDVHGVVRRSAGKCGFVGDGVAELLLDAVFGHAPGVGEGVVFSRIGRLGGDADEGAFGDRLGGRAGEG